MIPGWLSLKEAEILFSIVRYLNPRNWIVELGTYHGKSTRYLSAAALLSESNLVCVDRFTGDLPGEFAFKKNPLCPSNTEATAIHSADKATLGFTQHIHFWKEDTIWAAKHWHARGYPPVDVLFVDADHTKCRQDVEAWFPCLAPHALLMLHDFISDPVYGEDSPANTAHWLLRNGWGRVFLVDRLLLLTRDPLYWNVLEERSKDEDRQAGFGGTFNPDIGSVYVVDSDGRKQTPEGTDSGEGAQPVHPDAGDPAGSGGGATGT